MRRDTIAYSLAGTVFGFVLGYMAAGWGGGMPAPAPVATAAAPAAAAAAAEPSPRASIDPDEVKALESLAARQPRNAAPRVELGNMYMDAQQLDDAIRWYTEALQISPDNPDVETDLGACYVHSGRAAVGLLHFEAVLKAHPDHRLALYNRGVALLDLGRQKEAANAWEELLRRFPNDPQAARVRERIDQIRAVDAATATAGPGGGR